MVNVSLPPENHLITVYNFIYTLHIQFVFLLDDMQHASGLKCCHLNTSMNLRLQLDAAAKTRHLLWANVTDVSIATAQETRVYPELVFLKDIHSLWDLISLHTLTAHTKSGQRKRERERARQ